MNWYRIELNEDGAVLACALVTRDRLAGRQIYFIRAETADQAIERLLVKRAHRLKLARERGADRRERLIGDGLCKSCGKNFPDEDRRTCGTCRKADSTARGDRRAHVPRPALTPAAQAVRELKAQTSAKLGSAKAKRTRVVREKLALLAEIVELFDGLAPQEFRAALVRRIAELRSAATLAVVLSAAAPAPSHQQDQDNR